MQNEKQNISPEPKPGQNAPTPPPQSPTPEDQPEERSIGGLIGIIIIVAILVIGGLYFWGKQINDAQTAQEILDQPDPQTESLEAQGSSDDIESIENDLEATELENLDKELQDIEEEMENI